MEAQQDEPYGDLPPASPVRLDANPLEAAVLEIRFESDTSDLTASIAQAVLADLPDEITQVEPASEHELALAVGPDGQMSPEASVSARGWQFSTADRSVVFTVLAGRASVQVGRSRYERWSTGMRPRAEALMGILAATFEPSIVTRLGLRYINRLPGGPDEWGASIDRSVLGALAHPALGPLVRHAQQELLLGIEPGVGVLIRHGLVPGQPNGPGGYLVDVDAFVENSAGFDIDAVLAQAQRLNRTSFSVFQQVLSPGGLSGMEPAELEEYSSEGGSK